MRTPRLAQLLVAAVLTGAPTVAALAQPVAQSAPTEAVASAPRAARAVASDAQKYAEREAKDATVADFRGGSGVLIIGGSTVAIVLLVVLLVILL